MKDRRRLISNSVQDEFSYTTLMSKKVVKVIKGGRRMRFFALVVAGNKKGLVGFGTGKADDVQVSIEKAKKAAVKNVFRIPIINKTIPHEVFGKYNGSKIVFFPASSGTGIKVGGAARVVCESAGIEDIMSKYIRRNGKPNGLMAAIEAFMKLRDPVSIARDRGVTLEKVFNG